MCVHRSAILLSFIGGLVFCGSASAQTQQYFAVMAGGFETQRADKNAQGVATFMLGGPGEICFSVMVRNIDTPPTAAHIHRGNPGIAGDIVLPFPTPKPAGIPKTFETSGCLKGQNQKLLQEIRS